MLHDWRIEPREYARQEARRGRRHAFEALDPTWTALVVIDMVPFFLTENAYARGIVPNIRSLADALRAAGGTVAWVLPGSADPRHQRESGACDLASGRRVNPAVGDQPAAEQPVERSWSDVIEAAETPRRRRPADCRARRHDGCVLRDGGACRGYRVHRAAPPSVRGRIARLGDVCVGPSVEPWEVHRARSEGYVGRMTATIAPSRYRGLSLAVGRAASQNPSTVSPPGRITDRRVCVTWSRP